MLVALQINGKWDGQKYVFGPPSASKVYKGPVAKAFGGGGGGTTSEFVPTGPWSQQSPYIRGLFSEAARMYQNGPPQYYPGEAVAAPNQNLTQSWQDIDYQTGFSNDYLSAAMANALGAQTQPTMAGQVGAGQVMPYNTAINQLLQSSMQNPTQTLAKTALPAFYGGLSRANTEAAPVSTPDVGFGNVNANPAIMSSLYSNGINPYMQDVIDSALRASNRQFSQNVVPQISTAANMAGQLGGTRQGVAEGIAAQNQTQMQKDLIAQLMGQSFDVGTQERLSALGLVGAGQQANAQAALQAQQLAEQQRQASMGTGLNQAQLVGGLLGQGQQLGGQAAAQAGQLTGNMIGTGSAQNVQNSVQQAALMPGLSQAIMQSLGMGNQSGLQQYGIDQAGIDAALEKWFYQQYAPYNMLSQYQSWVTGPYGASEDVGGPGGANPLTPAQPGQPGAVGPGGQSWWGNPISVQGRRSPPTIAGLDANPLSGGNRRYAGTIDPTAGTVTIQNGGRRADRRSDQATQYLRGGDVRLGNRFNRIRQEIDNLRGQGWQWNPNSSIGNVLVGG